MPGSVSAIAGRPISAQAAARRRDAAELVGFQKEKIAHSAVAKGPENLRRGGRGKSAAGCGR